MDTKKMLVEVPLDWDYRDCLICGHGEAHACGQRLCPLRNAKDAHQIVYKDNKENFELGAGSIKLYAA